MYEDSNYRIILCGSNAYDKKYYFNPKFDKLPESVKEELRIISVLFTAEVGGIFTIGFTPTGDLVMDTNCEDGDLLYDDIGSALLVKKIRATKQEVFQAISIYYKVQFLHMNPSDLLETEEDSDLEDDNVDVFEGDDRYVEEQETRKVYSNESTPGAKMD